MTPLSAVMGLGMELAIVSNTAPVATVATVVWNMSARCAGGKRRYWKMLSACTTRIDEVQALTQEWGIMLNVGGCLSVSMSRSVFERVHYLI